MALLGLIGGPLLMASGIAIMFGHDRARFVDPGHRDDPGVLLRAVPRHLLIVKGFKLSPITDGLPAAATV
jgi:hypothetical protein